jgi:hypothetical protein
MSEPVTPAKLRELATRCEMEGPSIALEQAIARALGYHVHVLTCTAAGGNFRLPAYTTDLDAAVRLVPEGYAWQVGCEIDLTPFARVFGHDVHAADADASTPALALCAAALRARAALLETKP